MIQKKQLRTHDGVTAGGKVVCDIVTTIEDTGTDVQVPFVVPSYYNDIVWNTNKPIH